MKPSDTPEQVSHRASSFSEYLLSCPWGGSNFILRQTDEQLLARNWETAGIWQLGQLVIAESEEADLTDGTSHYFRHEIFT